MKCLMDGVVFDRTLIQKIEEANTKQFNEVMV